MSSSFQAKQKLEGLLNKNMRIRMTDGRTLVGLFLCTDRDCNVILGSAQEFLKSTGGINTSVLSSIYKIEMALWCICMHNSHLLIDYWIAEQISRQMIYCPVITDTFSQGEPRVLGLAMIPGHHVVSIEVEADSLEDAQGFGAKH